MDEKTRTGLEEFISLVGLTVVSYTAGYAVGWVIIEGIEKLKMQRELYKAYRSIKQAKERKNVKYTRKQFKEDVEELVNSDSREEWLNQWIKEFDS